MMLSINQVEVLFGVLGGTVFREGTTPLRRVPGLERNEGCVVVVVLFLL